MPKRSSYQKLQKSVLKFSQSLISWELLILYFLLSLATSYSFSIVHSIFKFYFKFIWIKNYNFFIQADQICYAVLCVFSYVAAGQEHKQAQAPQRVQAAPVVTGGLPGQPRPGAPPQGHLRHGTPHPAQPPGSPQHQVSTIEIDLSVFTFVTLSVVFECISVNSVRK